MSITAAWSSVAQLHSRLKKGNRQKELDSPGRNEEGLVGWIVEDRTGCQASNVAVHIGSGSGGAARDVDRSASRSWRKNDLKGNQSSV
jgi:hypothetical protein